jgi:hypothetical protein
MFDGTFRSASVFNIPLNWDTSKVTSMIGTFREAKAFD